MSARTTTILRIGCVIFILLALLDPRPFSAQSEPGAVLVLDVSASMGQGRAEPDPQWSLRRPWVLVADGTQEIHGPAEPSRLARRASRLEDALRAVASRHPGADVVLISDGRETHGDARAGARAIAAAGGRLFTQAPGRASSDVALLSARIAMSAPIVRVEVRVAASCSGAAQVELVRQGTALDVERLEVSGDGSPVTLMLEDREPLPGRVPYQIVLRTDPGTPNDDPENDRLELVRASDERVAEIWGDLGTQEPGIAGVGVRRRADRGVPVLDGVDVVVLSNVPWMEIGPEGAERLLHFVAGGGRLLVLGGRDAYGPGGWANTALEEALLPLRVRRPESPQFALLLLLDRSASTQGRALAYLSGAATRVVFGAVSGESVGVLPFSHVPASGLLGPGWLDGRAPLGTREALRSSLAELEARGGTDLPAALLQGVRVLSQRAARQRRLLLLSDGDPDHPPDVQGLQRARAEAEAAQIRVAVLLVGDPIAAQRLREHVVLRPDDVVELAAPEDVPDALWHWLGGERAQQELVPGAAALTRLEEGLPHIDVEGWRPLAMHALEVAPGAQEVLRTQAGTGQEALPFAARRVVGAGEVVALAWGPELEDPARWSAELARWAPWVQALAQASDRGLGGEWEGRQLSVEWAQARGEGRLLAWRQGAPAVELVEAEPGRFVADLGPDGARAAWMVARPSDPNTARPVHLPARPPLEHAGAGPDLAALGQIAQAGGGERLLAGSGPPRPRPVRGPSLAPGLLLLAVLCLLGERALLAWRRVPGRLRTQAAGTEAGE